MFLRNVGMYLQVYTVSQPRRSTWTGSCQKAGLVLTALNLRIPVEYQGINPSGCTVRGVGLDRLEADIVFHLRHEYLPSSLCCSVVLCR
jgi:hypothetical protein